MPVIGLDIDFALVVQTCGVATVAIDHREVDIVAFLPAFRIEGTCAQEDAHHVVYTVIVGVLFPCVLSIVFLAMLHDMALTSGVGIEDFVNRVSVTLACTFAVIKWRHVQTVVTQQGVAKHEEVVNAVVATGDEASAPCRSTFVDTLYRGEGRCSGLYPYELPIIVEVVGEEFSRLERSVPEGALRSGLRGYQGQHKTHKPDLKCFHTSMILLFCLATYFTRC